MAEEKNNQQQKLAVNRQAWHDYFIEERFEAGIELCGTEVKSVRGGKVNLKEAYCSVDGGELFVNAMHISPYEMGNIYNRNPLRKRRLLMHRREIMKLYGQMTQKGLTLIPLSLYFKGSNVKMEVGLCRGKKLYDKREAAAVRDATRELQRRMKDRDD